jgi:hypothetical protein
MLEKMESRDVGIAFRIGRGGFPFLRSQIAPMQMLSSAPARWCEPYGSYRWMITSSGNWDTFMILRIQVAVVVQP